jgi:hypothetical protein
MSGSIAGYNGVLFVSPDSGTTWHAVGELKDVQFKRTAKMLDADYPRLGRRRGFHPRQPRMDRDGQLSRRLLRRRTDRYRGCADAGHEAEGALRSRRHGGRQAAAGRLLLHRRLHRESAHQRHRCGGHHASRRRRAHALDAVTGFLLLGRRLGARCCFNPNIARRF